MQVDLPRDLEASMRKILATAPKGWDVLRLGCRLHPNDDPTLSFCQPCMSQVAPAGGTETVLLHDDPSAHTCDRAANRFCHFVSGGTHAIVYNYESLPRLLAMLQAPPEPHRPKLNIDVALSMPSDPSIRSYCVQLEGVRPDKVLPSDRVDDGRRHKASSAVKGDIGLARDEIGSLLS